MGRSVTPPLAAPPRDPLIAKHYHAHIYCDPESTRDLAALFRERVAAAFPAATIGRWHGAPVGPHTKPMDQIAFSSEVLATLLPWLMLNRDGLTIPPHPETSDAYAGHTDHAVWFGAILRLDVLRVHQAPSPATAGH
jgi:DOPA 4,5-dioxygenase